MEYLIDIPGRLHSVAVEKHIAGADQIYDDVLKTTLDILNLENITDVKVQDGNKLQFLNIQGLVLKEISIASEQKQSDWNLTDSTQVDFIKNKPTVYNKLEVDDKLITKQDTIDDLATIRSGAQAGATAYQKPVTGIPATDLASAVQVSLGKADTALLEHQSLAGLVNTGNYNTVSKKIELKHDNTVLAEIDATAFIKDGMVSSVTINNGYLVITFNTDAGKEPISIALTDIFNPANYYDKTAVDNLLANKVDKENGKGLSTNDYTTAEKTKLGALPTNEELTQALGGKANTSDLAEVATTGSYNDLSDKPDLSAFITKSVNDLTNYYLKSETYTKNEVLQLIGAIQQFHYEVYPTLPQTGASNVLYLIGPTGSGSDKYEEYVYANNDWTKIGDTSIDLSGYVTTEALTTALADYVTSSALSTILSSYVNKDEIDDVPTANSKNPVKSGGVYDAVKDTVKNTRPDLSDRFSVADPNGYIGFEIDKNGNLLSPTIEALKSQVPDNIDKRYNDNIIVADSDGNIAFVIDKNGNILSKSIDDCGKNPFRTKSLYTIGDSLFCSNVWQETCAQALGCLYDANVNTNPEYPTSAGGTNSYMKYMLSTYMRVLNLIKQDVIPNQGKDAIIILGNSNDNIFDFNTNARAYKCDDIIELSELTTENLASVDVSERSLNVAIKLPQISIGTLLTITQLPVREGDINLNVGWSADGHYDYKIHVVPQATQEETLAYVMERILEYDYGSVFDVKMSDDSVGFTMGGAFYPAVLFTDIGNTGMQVATSQSDNVTYYMLKWLNSDDISEWTNTAKWVDGNASSGWKSSIEELQRHYPLAQIAILNCPKIVIDMTDSSMIRPNGTYNQEAFADAILPVIEGVTKRNKDIADFYQVKFIDVWSELGVSANNVLSFYPASGNVHTNKQGQQRWGELIAGAIKGWIL